MYRTFLPNKLLALWKLDEASNTDRLNSLNPATLTLAQTGAVPQVAGPSAGLPFGASCSATGPLHLDCLNQAGLNPNGPCSASWWMKKASLAVGTSQLLNWLYTGTSNGWLLTSFFGGPPDVLYAYCTSNAGNFNQNTWLEGNPPDTGWHHYAVTNDGILQSCYLDGKLVGVCSNVGPLSSGNGDLSLLAVGVGSVVEYSQVALWGRLLTQGEINLLFNGGNGLPPPW